jgi:hypothetical protein
MKLNKIASAIGITCLALSSSAAWADTVNAADAAAGVTSTYTNTTGTGGATQTVTGSSTLVNPAATTSTTSRTDVASTSNGSQKTTVFTTPQVNLGGQVAGTTQGTLGGAGGVGGTITTGVATTTYNALSASTSTTIAAGVVYAAGSVFNGVAQTAGGTTAAKITVSAGDVLISGVATNVAGAGIAGSDHDFTKGTTYNGGVTVGLCTYCHTPHKAGSTLLLWNHTLSTQTFAWDVAATTAGTALPGFVGNSYKGPSAKCLSCHDGSVAIGDIGWFNQTARTGSAAANVSSVKMTNTQKLMGQSAGDLSGVHPVAIPYPLNGAPNVYNGSTTGARLATNDFVTDPTANNMRLYSDVGGGQIVGKVQAGKTGIECSTCHDPHNRAATDRFLLRGKLVGSTQASGYICLQCHTK